MKEKKVAFVSLGCDKNLVDSEKMLELLNEANFLIVSDESAADIIVVNTCCFIKDALEESIETILEMAQYKEGGSCKGIVVAGCLGQRYKKEVFEQMPEVDAVVGTSAIEEIVKAVTEVLEGKKHVLYMESIDKLEKEQTKRILSTAGYFAYLKIAEGCDCHCTYCVIPKIRGKYRSRHIESLVEEAKNLAGQGVKELLLVAQDTALYGKDLYGESKLAELLEALCKVEGLEWIRLLYCYPEHITQKTIEVMSREPKICHYIDIPLQHADDTILKKMGRRSNQKLIREKIEYMRKLMPDIAVRTTFITGFPQETEQEFENLLAFVKEMKFDRLGVFTYSQEENTPAAQMEGQIAEEIKEERKEKLMEMQKFISAEKCESFVGKTIKVLIEGRLPEEDVYCARSYRDAPEIDGLVFVSSKEELLSGEFADVLITQASDYDLIGEVVYGNESGK